MPAQLDEAIRLVREARGRSGYTASLEGMSSLDRFQRLWRALILLARASDRTEFALLEEIVLRHGSSTDWLVHINALGTGFRSVLENGALGFEPFIHEDVVGSQRATERQALWELVRDACVCDRPGSALDRVRRRLPKLLRGMRNAAAHAMARTSDVSHDAAFSSACPVLDYVLELGLTRLAGMSEAQLQVRLQAPPVRE